MNVQHFDLQHLARAVEKRADEWVAKDVRWELHEGPKTSKPAAWLVLRKGGADGQLTLWTSGELELEWGTSAADTHCEHHEVMDRGELGHLVDLLAARVLACAR